MDLEHHKLIRALLMNRFKMFIAQQNVDEAQNVLDIAGRMGYFDLRQTMLQYWCDQLNKNRTDNDV